MAENKKGPAMPNSKAEHKIHKQRNYTSKKCAIQVEHKTLSEILNMKGSEGLIVRCTENQIDNILSIMVDEELITSPDVFRTVITFETGIYPEDNRILFLFDNVKDPSKINIPKLAVWRILTQDYFNGTWLSDFIQNMKTGAGD